MLSFKKKSLVVFYLDASYVATTDFGQISRAITEIFSTPPPSTTTTTVDTTITFTSCHDNVY
jgi:hypothetical protein